MKKIYFLTLLLIGSSIGYAQDADTTLGWRVGGRFSLNFSQASFTNWAAGGQNSVAGNVIFAGIADYKGTNNYWENTLLTSYGLIQQGNNDLQKSDDRLELNSLYGVKAFGKHWYYSGIMNFRTQYTVGYGGDDLDVKASNFMAPGYLNLGLGLDYRPNDNFQVFISPADAKLTFVLDQDLADNGDYGVDAAVFNADGVKIQDGKNMLFQFGAYVRATYNNEIMKNVNLFTSLDLFSNYLDNPQNIDINWEVLLGFKINEWLTASLNTTLIYDNDISFIRTLDDGTTEMLGARTQFKQVFNLGVVFNLGAKIDDE